MANKFNPSKRAKRPVSVKGKYKQVDPRMEKDTQKGQQSDLNMCMCITYRQSLLHDFCHSKSRTEAHEISTTNR